MKLATKYAGLLSGQSALRLDLQLGVWCTSVCRYSVGNMSFSSSSQSQSSLSSSFLFNFIYFTKISKQVIQLIHVYTSVSLDSMICVCGVFVCNGIRSTQRKLQLSDLVTIWRPERVSFVHFHHHHYHRQPIIKYTRNLLWRKTNILSTLPWYVHALVIFWGHAYVMKTP